MYLKSEKAKGIQSVPKVGNRIELLRHDVARLQFGATITSDCIFSPIGRAI
jgi:hypothetical protein